MMMDTIAVMVLEQCFATVTCVGARLNQTVSQHGLVYLVTSIYVSHALLSVTVTRSGKRRTLTTSLFETRPLSQSQSMSIFR